MLIVHRGSLRVNADAVGISRWAISHFDRYFRYVNDPASIFCHLTLTLATICVACGAVPHKFRMVTAVPTKMFTWKFLLREDGDVLGHILPMSPTYSRNGGLHGKFRRLWCVKGLMRGYKGASCSLSQPYIWAVSETVALQPAAPAPCVCVSVM